jgi:hypothetical protein
MNAIVTKLGLACVLVGSAVSAFGQATTTTTTAAAATTTTAAPAATTTTAAAATTAAGVGAVNGPIKAVVPAEGAAVTDADKMKAIEDANDLAHYATFGFRFFYVQRQDEDKFSNLITERTEELYWHADYLSDEDDRGYDRWYFAYGEHGMYLSKVSVGQALTGTRIADQATEEAVGSTKVAAAGVDASGYDRNQWLDGYADARGNRYQASQVNLQNWTATDSEGRTVRVVRQRNQWQQTHDRYSASVDSGTLNACSALDADVSRHIIGRALMQHYRTDLWDHPDLNFVAHAFLVSLGNYTERKNAAGEVDGVCADVVIRLPNRDTIYMAHGGLYSQWRYNFHNLRDFSGIDPANSYYGATYYTRRTSWDYEDAVAYSRRLAEMAAASATTTTTAAGAATTTTAAPAATTTTAAGAATTTTTARTATTTTTARTTTTTR